MYVAESTPLNQQSTIHWHRSEINKMTQYNTHMRDLATKQILQTSLWKSLYSSVPWALLVWWMLRPRWEMETKSVTLRDTRPQIPDSWEAAEGSGWTMHDFEKNVILTLCLSKALYWKGFGVWFTSPQWGLPIKDAETTISRCLLAGAASASAAAWASSAASQRHMKHCGQEIRSIHNISIQIKYCNYMFSCCWSTRYELFKMNNG